MSYFATANGLPVIGGSLLIPLVGAWTADLVLAGQDPLPVGPATVVIGNLTLQGTVYRSAVYGGQVKARLVAGAGGWRNPVPPQGYGNPGGIQLSTVLGDVAVATGESIIVAADVNIGTAYARVAFPSSVASDVLWQMVAQGFIPSWRVDVDGITRTDAWPATVIGTPFTVTDQRPEEGLVEVATEDYASWLPGCVFSAPQLDTSYTSAGVLYRWGSDGAMRFDVLTAAPGTGDRVLGPVQQLVDSRVAPLRFFGRYAYTISNAKATTIDGAPVDTTLGLPDLCGVPIRGSSLASYVPPNGGQADIQFLDGQPTKPVCVWTQADASAGPTEIVVGPQGTGANGIARVSDTVTVLFPPIMQIAGIVSGAPFIGVLTITTPGIGTIATGSNVAKAAQSS
jgi:hypothetical protein